MVHMRHGRWLIASASLAAALLAAGCTGSQSGGSAVANRPAAPSPLAGGAAPADASGEVNAERQPQSTFAIDVDTASYAYSRRQILDGHRPDPATVRPEEFVNAFQQDYPQPAGSGFTVTLDGADLPDAADAPGTTLLRVGLQTRDEDSASRADAALTFVIDVSGSMGEPGRLDLVQDALHTLVNQLRDTDSVAIVAYESKAHVLRTMTPVRSRTALHQAIDNLKAGGSTNLEAGLVTGYRVAREGFVPGATNRVVLLSDGLANVGNTTATPILEQIREEAAKQIALLGVGVGSQYGDALMEQLADQGDGFVTYVSNRSQARQLFVTRLPATLSVRALDAKAQVTFDPSTVVSYRLIGYDDRALAPSQFRDDTVDGGEVGPGHSVTAIYLVRLRDGASGQVATARVRWVDPIDREPREIAESVLASELRGGFAGASPRLKVCYAAAFFAEVLRQGPGADQVSLDDLASVADDAYRATEDPQVRELADLIRRSGG